MLIDENRGASMRRVLISFVALGLITAMVSVGGEAVETAPGGYSPALRNWVASAIAPMHAPPAIKIRQSGGGAKPLITGVTDLPDGGILRVSLKQTLACAPNDCSASTPPSRAVSDRVTIRNGGFQAGPFSFAGSPLPAGTYTIEILLETGDPDHMFYQPGLDHVVIKPGKASSGNWFRP